MGLSFPLLLSPFQSVRMCLYSLEDKPCRGRNALECMAGGKMPLRILIGLWLLGRYLLEG